MIHVVRGLRMVGVVFACVPVMTSAQYWREEDKVAAGEAGDLFGFSVACSKETAMIGALYDDTLGDYAGAVHVFERVSGAWTRTVKLTAEDGEAFDLFGRSSALSGDTAVVGANGDDDEGEAAGAVHVFEKTSGAWSQVDKLTASDGAAGDSFGWSVALAGDLLAVGAYNDDDRGESSGSVHLFERAGGVWAQVDKLIVEDGAAFDAFGWSVALTGETVTIGAPGDDDLGENSGSVYVFERVEGVWAQVAKLTADDGAASDAFGQTVASSSDAILVGAIRGDGLTGDTGTVYVFDRVGQRWVQTARLVAQDGARGDLFGGALAFSNNTALIGAVADDDGGAGSGSVYVFQRAKDAWTPEAKLTAGDAAPNDRFGAAVAVFGVTAWIGATLDDDLGRDSGSAYVFERGLDCAGGERLAKAKCETLGKANQLKATLKGGTANDTFTVTLTDGSNRSGTLNRRGQGKVKFNHVPSGPGTAWAEWGCGATDQKNYTCP